ncbi:MAG: hypothetical protein WBW88_11380 [Rhodothermales bacterium]
MGTRELRNTPFVLRGFTVALESLGKYDLEDYEPCLYKLITTQYEPVAGLPEVWRRKRP